MQIRTAKRAAVVAVSAAVSVTVTTLLTAAPAFASDPVGPKEGNDPGHPLGLAGALLLFIGTPVVTCLVIAAVVLLPGAVRSNRYRPAEGWSATPVWFAGPVDPDAALAGASRGDVVRGGASGSW